MGTFPLGARRCWPRPSGDEFPQIDGTSLAVRRLKREMARVAGDPDVTVLLTGESGTGKDRIARAIHAASPRARAPFVVVDCAGLSPSLVEDSLFGHVRGAFTGAIADREGPFERAAGGTVFLDEIGELTIDLQLRLLRVLQSRVVVRLGSAREVGFDARILAATNVDLAAARARGRFRDDLFYRLSVYEIRVPPLRRRGAPDIIALIGSIVERLAGRRGIRPPSVSPEAMDVLVRHSWPGNVRELENAVERSIVAAAGEGILSADHLPEHLASVRDAVPAGEPITRERVLEALERHAFRRGPSAAALGLSRHQLYRLEKRHGIAYARRRP